MRGIKVQDLSDEKLTELKNLFTGEQQRRDAVKAEERKQQRIALNKRLFKHKKLLLSTMEHNRQGCSDDDPDQDGTCHKCALLSLEDWDLDRRMIEVQVRMGEV